MSDGMKSFGKLAFGTGAALLLGLALSGFMDEEHTYVKGPAAGAFSDRRERVSEAGSTKNWASSQYFINKDGLAIFWRSWLPTPGHSPMVKGIIILSHGMGEHSGRYEVLGTMLAQKGFAVYALDHQGHGQSEGTRMHVKWFADYISDVHQLTEMAKNKHPTVAKTFLLGHSMGALISIHAVSQAPRLYNGVVLSAPPLKVLVAPPVRAILPALAQLLPKLPGPGLDLRTLCHDNSVVDRYFNDPLNNMGPNTIRLLAEVVGAVDAVPTFSSKFPIPYLLMHGTEDRMCLYDGSKTFHETTKVEDKTFVTYEGAFHELYNEPDSMEKAIPETIKWLEARL